MICNNCHTLNTNTEKCEKCGLILDDNSDYFDLGIDDDNLFDDYDDDNDNDDDNDDNDENIEFNKKGSLKLVDGELIIVGGIEKDYGDNVIDGNINYVYDEEKKEGVRDKLFFDKILEELSVKMNEDEDNNEDETYQLKTNSNNEILILDSSGIDIKKNRVDLTTGKKY